mmetsp:Transcript_2075/g.2977  ORF Transcript_2075/g.2977 Transcript_2075/m.2977 type:complete len:208 (+) Transcript_2075:38-661(+)
MVNSVEEEPFISDEESQKGHVLKAKFQYVFERLMSGGAKAASESGFGFYILVADAAFSLALICLYWVLYQKLTMEGCSDNLVNWWISFSVFATLNMLISGVVAYHLSSRKNTSIFTMAVIGSLQLMFVGMIITLIGVSVVSFYSACEEGDATVKLVRIWLVVLWVYVLLKCLTQPNQQKTEVTTVKSRSVLDRSGRFDAQSFGSART